MLHMVIVFLIISAPVWAGEPTRDDDKKPAIPEADAAADNPGDPGKAPTVRASIDVTARLPDSPAVTVLGGDRLDNLPPKDAGDLLRVAPGVSSGRMGGHGLDPRVRGLGEGSIRILLDGAEIHGGCPNRMDPPSSFAAVEAFDRVTVVRGVQTLRYGTAVGTVLFEKDPVRFLDDSWWRAGVNLAGGTYNNGPAIGVNASFGSSKFSVEAGGDQLNMESYSDGDGEVVPSAYDSRNASLALGWTPDAMTSLSISYQANRTRDALYAGAGMDSPFSDNDAIRLKFRRGAGSGVLGEIAADVYRSDVKHLMDNYSLREWTAPMAMRAPSTSDSTGGRIWSDLVVAPKLELTVGLDIARNQRQALRFAGPNPGTVEMLQSVLWPDVDLNQGGLLLEGAYLLRGNSRLRFGLRGDRHSASAAAADLKPAGMNLTPRALWESYYELVDDRWDKTALGGFVRWEQQLEETGFGFFVGLSRTARAADTTQRYMAANSGNPGLRWIGNPNLDAAVHNQLDAGLSWSGPKHTADVTVFFDDVEDEILRDRAHGQDGILKNDNATIYRNIEARRTGVELVAQWRLGSGVTLGGDAAFVYAQNTTDDRPIAQTPPFEGSLFAGWSSAILSATGTVRWASLQTRVDDNPLTGSGLDSGETPGWAILDLSGSWDAGAGFRLIAGIDNTFDRTYAYHLNRDDFFDPVRIQINEPGRTFWLRVGWTGGN